MSIKWADYFDHIYCVHYAPQSHKLPRLIDELKRVGIFDSGIFTMRFTYPNQYADILFKQCNNANCPNPGCINLGLEMLSVMNEANGYGYGKILVLENDVAFLKNLGAVDIMLANMPSSDIIQFDKFVVPNGEAYYKACCDERRINGIYFDPRGDIYYSGACFALNARGIEYERQALSMALQPPDSTFAPSGLKRAIAITNLAIQVVYRNTVSADLYGINSHHDGYKRGCVDYSLYNLPDGYMYGSAL